MWLITPYIFRHGRYEFIPIKAVFAVVECKSTSIDELGTAKEGTWLDKIKRLKTSEESIARLSTGIVIDRKSYTYGERKMEQTGNISSIQLFVMQARQENLEVESL